jgi:hypothetical protein
MSRDDGGACARAVRVRAVGAWAIAHLIDTSDIEVRLGLRRMLSPQDC